MEQYQEFILNHPFLIGAFVVTLALVVFMEMQRRVGRFKEVTPAVAVRLQNDDGVFVDIRDVGDYRKGHLLNAKNIPLGELEDRVHELKKFTDKPVIAYCATGNRSLKAGKILGKHGFEQVYVMSGGLSAWEKASLPIEKK